MPSKASKDNQTNNEQGTNDMIRPTLNINGSSAAELIDPRRAAMDHLMDAIEALKQVTPNGRDYLCQRDRLTADRNTHFDRLAALHTMREELLDEALHIQQQEKAA
jgi:hypothetical protein